MLASRIIEPSTSGWAAPIVPIKKKDGTLRICVDNWHLNVLSMMDTYLMACVDEIIDSVGRARFITHARPCYGLLAGTGLEKG